MVNEFLRGMARAGLLCALLLLGGCTGNVGVGLNVGIPVGNHGYMSVGTSRWL